MPILTYQLVLNRYSYLISPNFLRGVTAENELIPVFIGAVDTKLISLELRTGEGFNTTDEILYFLFRSVFDLIKSFFGHQHSKTMTWSDAHDRSNFSKSNSISGRYFSILYLFLVL